MSRTEDQPEPAAEDDASSLQGSVVDDAPSFYGSVIDLDGLPLSGHADDHAPGPTGDHPFDAREDVRYRDGHVVARGGMGQVSAVTDARLRRQVALKEAMTAGGAGLERRLAQEAWITAHLEHPGIVPVYDAGRAPDGRPFFTMRLIRGRSLATALADGDLDESTLLRHFLTVCQAMGYAHAMGVVHRDLKPANVMLGEFGETQIVDWGLARGVDAEDGDAEAPAAAPLLPDALAAQTMAGARVGTPAYMSPEQAHAGRLGRTSDVWSLGAILLEIVTGQAPYAGLSTAEIFARLARGPIPRAEDIRPDAPAELRAIIDHALRRDPERRYADAKQLADDDAAYLDGRRVRAFDYSAWDLVKRFARTFRVPLLIIVLAMVTVGVVFALSYSQTLDERDRAQAAERSAKAARDRAVSAEQQTAEALSEADASYAELLVRGAQEATRHDARAEAELLAAHALLRGPSPEARGVLARWGVPARPRLASATPAPPCLDARLSPSGALLLCVEADATSLWDAAPLALRWRAPLRLDGVEILSDEQALVEGPMWSTPALLDLDISVAIPRPRNLDVRRARSGGGTVLVDSYDNLGVWTLEDNGFMTMEGPIREPRAVSGDGRVGIVYDEPAHRAYRVDLRERLISPLPPLPFRPGHGPMSVALDEHGRRAAYGSTNGDLVVIDTESGALRWQRAITDRALTHVSWAPGDRWLAARDERGSVSLVDTTGQVTLALPRIRARTFAWRVDAEGLALLVLGDELRVYRAPGTTAADAYRTNPGIGISMVALSRDGALVALPDGDGEVRVFDVATGALAASLPGDGRAVAKAAAFFGDPGSPRLAVAWPGRFRLATWDLGDAPERPVPLRVNYRRVVGTARGVAVANYGQVVQHVVDGEVSWTIRTSDGGSPVDLTASPDGRVIAWLSSRGAVEMARLEGDDLGPRRVVDDAPLAFALALDGTGERLALARASAVDVIDVASGERVRSVEGGRVVAIALSRDGEQIAAGMIDGTVWVWGPEGGEPRMIGAGHLERVSGVVFGPEARWLVSVGWDGVALRWDLTGLDADPRALVRELERSWGVGLPHATRADLR